MSRRYILLILTSCFLSLGVSATQAQDWPSRLIRIVVPFPAGGSADVSARLVADFLQKTLGQSVIVEIKPGSGGNLAAVEVARSELDGNTLFFGTNGTQTINGSLYSKLPFDAEKDFAPISMIWEAPNLVVVHPSVPAKNLEELIAYARANPGKINFGSSGLGSPTHLAGEMFKALTNTDIAHVPYRGQGAALTDLIAGRIQVMFPLVPDVVTHIQSGAVKPLAVAASKRSALLPEIPTSAESKLPGLISSSWIGVFARKGTPQPVIDRLDTEIGRLLRSAEFGQRLAKLGIEIQPISRAEFTTKIVEERPRWRKLISDLQIKVD